MDEISILESLVDELLKGIQDIMLSGEILSDEFQMMLAQELDATLTRIDELRSQQSPIEQAEEEQAQISNELAPEEPEAPAPPSGPAPPVNPTPFPSSNINGFRYDPKNGRLFVKFQGKFPAQNGPVYSYEGVPEYIYDVFRRGAVGPKTSGSNRWHTWKQGVTPSHGAAMAALIKNGGFQYRRLS